MEKSSAAFRTIGEVSEDIGVPQHVLRYWETRFPQLKPITRAGNRRYYRPQDVALVRRIHDLLAAQGYTVKGVQKILAERRGSEPAPIPKPANNRADLPIDALLEIRAVLARALEI